MQNLEMIKYVFNQVINTRTIKAVPKKYMLGYKQCQELKERDRQEDLKKIDWSMVIE